MTAERMFGLTEEQKRDVIIAAGARLHLPAIYSFGFYIESDGPISYGIDQTELLREAASYIDRILRGAKPASQVDQLPLAGQHGRSFCARPSVALTRRQPLPATVAGVVVRCVARPHERTKGHDGPTRKEAEETPTMRLTTFTHYLIPFVALGGGIFVLLRPQLLNYIVAVYLILVGSIGLNSLFHFVR